MKKTISVIIAVLLVFTSAAGCGHQKETVLPVHVEGSIFGGKSADSIGLDLRFSPEWIAEKDNTAYSRDLAAFAALISADTYFRTKDLDRGTQNRVLIDGMAADGYDQTVLLSTLGFSDVRYVESFKTENYETDTKDSVTMTLGYCSCRDKYDCFVIGIRGCFSSAEWDSFFDPGCSSAAYTSYTGEHPEWTDTDIMKGIGVASARAMKIAREYISSHADASRKTCVLVTGHSRGGDIAQIIGAELENDPSVKSFKYTFNSSPVTAREGARDFRTVFNIFDSADFLADCLPFAYESFYRYGRTLSLNIEGNADIEESVSGIKGENDYRCMNDEAAAEYRELFPEEIDICAIADLIMENAADISGGHRLLNSYVLTKYLE